MFSLCGVDIENDSFPFDRPLYEKERFCADPTNAFDHFLPSLHTSQNKLAIVGFNLLKTQLKTLQISSYNPH